MTRAYTIHTPAAVWAWACAGALVGLFIALLVFAPARWLASALDQTSNGRLRLSHTLGTVWAGSAQLTLTGGSGSRDAARLPSRIQWQLMPGWDHVIIQVRASCCTPQPLSLKVTPQWGGLQLALGAGQSTWPAGMLSGLGTPWNTVKPEGVLSLASTGLTVRLTSNQLSLDGGLKLEALNLSSSLSTLRPMGSYGLTLTGGTTPSLQLDTLSGSLHLSGHGQWIGSRLRFEGAASAAPEHESELSNLLNIIGRRDGARSIITLG